MKLRDNMDEYKASDIIQLQLVLQKWKMLEKALTSMQYGMNQ